jgi:hypothetical protein
MTEHPLRTLTVIAISMFVGLCAALSQCQCRRPRAEDPSVQVATHVPAIVTAGRVSNLPAGDSITVGTGGYTGSTITELPCDAGLLAAQTRLDDWNPACLATNTQITVQASDNSGTPITGIDAHDNSFAVGRRLELCNVTGPEDAAVLQLENMGRMPGSNTAHSNVANFILTPGAGQGGRCSVATATACHVDGNCPVGQTCVMLVAPFTIAPNQCATMTYAHPWVSVGDATGVAWIVERTPRIDNVITQALTFYPVLYTDDSTGTIDAWNPTATFPTQGTYQCSPGNFTCGEAGNDLTLDNNSVIVVNTSTGLTIEGIRYDTQAVGPAALGPVKVIVNNGPGTITIANHASGTGVDNVETGANGDARGNVVLIPNETVIVWHPRDSGTWVVLGKRDYWFHSLVTGTSGSQWSGYDSTQPLGAAFDTTLTAIHSAAGTTNAGVSSYAELVARDVGSYSTAGGATSVYGLFDNLAATKSAGAAGLTQVAAYLSASSASAVNFALQTDSGNDQFNISSGYSSFVHDVFIGAAAMCSKGTPTVNNGALDAFSTNCYGRITGIGANTSVTLTYSFVGTTGGAFAGTSRCITQIEGSTTVGVEVSTVSTTAPVFSCFAYATGAAANCPNFNYWCTGY